jgi:CHAD domain-containing protein
MISTTQSKRARRAIERAAHDRPTQIAAGALAGAGAALAAGKAALDRRSEADSDGADRTYRLRRSEPVAAGIRRIALGRTDDALDQLRGAAGSDAETAVHETRKDLKKVRSLLRLVRDEIGPDTYTRENERYRDAGRLLAGARDAKVKQDTLAALAERYDEVPDNGGRAFAKALREEQRDGAETGERVERAIAAIEAGREAVAGWPLGGGGWSVLEPGLRRAYRRGRRRFADVRAEGSDEAVHEWRKRVKDHWYHLRLLRNAWQPVMAESADRAHELADLLGDHHDLAVLRDDALARREIFAEGELQPLLDAIAARQEELLEGALALGQRVYAEKPSAFARRLEAYWPAWR